MSHHFHFASALAHHPHFGSGFHRPRWASNAARGSATLWITFALVVIAMVVVSGIDALPGH
ncbi:hypothetical protein GXW82_31905 [Streptacidiphilus sp. 4-A2]|nr:hypothetical protein [Streptacidiphilus sp. 4-A2]